MVVAIIALVLGTTGTGVAAVSAIRNADAVDGKSAVSSHAKLSQAAGKLVATAKSGPDKGRFPPKFVANVMRGGAASFAKVSSAPENGPGSAFGLATITGIGIVSAACGDADPSPTNRDAQLALTYTNNTGQYVNTAWEFGQDRLARPRFVSVAPGGSQSFTLGRSNTYNISLEQGIRNVQLQGVTRNDAAGLPAASCLVYGTVLRVG
jgi:hypothetical protein